jgi:hypothetical protein
MGVREFVLTPLNDPDQTRAGGLYLHDPVAGGKLIKVSGLDGKPWSHWAGPCPGTTSIGAQLADGSYYLIDPLNGAPAQPLGRHSRVYGFVPGSTSLIIDERRLQGTRPGHGYNLPLPAIAVPGPALHELLPLGGRGYIGLLATQAGGSLRYSVAVISDGTSARSHGGPGRAR